MNKEETMKLLEKIKTFRQSFLVKKDTVDNWLNILKDYDYKDVDEKLDEYFEELEKARAVEREYIFELAKKLPIGFEF